MNIALFTSDEISSPLSLCDKRAEHIIKILHKNCGDSFDAGIIGGNAGKARITQIDKTHIYFDFIPDSDGKPLHPLIMLIGFPRPIQLKRLFRDMAGLGVKEIHLLGTELGEKSYMQSNIIEKGQAEELLLEGSVQGKSTHVPKLFLHKNLKECFSFFKDSTEYKNGLKILLDNISPKGRLADIMKKNAETFQTDNLNKNPRYVFAAIGSERGWTDNERQEFYKNDFEICSMGSRVLRTETAATVAASIILSEMEII